MLRRLRLPFSSLTIQMSKLSVELTLYLHSSLILKEIALIWLEMQRFGMITLLSHTIQMVWSAGVHTHVTCSCCDECPLSLAQIAFYILAPGPCKVVSIFPSQPVWSISIHPIEPSLNIISTSDLLHTSKVRLSNITVVLFFCNSFPDSLMNLTLYFLEGQVHNLPISVSLEPNNFRIFCFVERLEYK